MMASVQTARRRIGHIQQSGVRRLQRKLIEWMDAVQKHIVKELNKLRKDQVSNIVDDTVDFEVIETEGKAIVKPMILNIINESRKTAYKLARMEMTLDLLNPAAVELAETICAEMVREVTDNTKAGLRWIIREGVKEGKSIPKIAREIRPKVGLTEYQMKVVANFEERLLIDRPELSRKQIDRRVRTYEKRMHRRRATTIARTETDRAVSEGALIAYEDAGVNVKWLTVANPCDICEPNSGNEYRIEEAHGLLPFHPNCRCSWTPAV